MPGPSNPNTSEVARRIGVSRAAASRYRAGLRVPKIDVRKRIESEIGWPITEQATAEASGHWSRQFNAELDRAYLTAGQQL